MSKKLLRPLGALLVLLTLLTALPLTSGAAKTVTKSDISQQQAKLNSLSAKADSYRAQLRTAEKKENALEEELKTYDSLMATYQEYVDTAEGLIAGFDEEIGTLDEKIADAEAEYDRKYAYFKERLRATYEEGNISTLQLIFGAGNFLQMLESLERSGDLLNYDVRIMRELEDSTEQLRTDRSTLDSLRAEQKTTREAYTAKCAEMETVIAEKEEAIGALREEIGDLKSVADYYIELEEQAEKQLDAIYNAYLAQEKARKEAEEKARREAEEKAKQSGNKEGNTVEIPKTPSYQPSGAPLWPLPAKYKLITSNYGWRNHPISGVRKLHKGTDIYAPKNTDIYAVYDGKVIYSGYDTSYGNYILIDHGKGLTTLYAHCNKRLVNSGDYVKRGQTIGKVGMTGGATGYHLHFEWRVNGTAENAMKHLVKP